MNFDDIVGNSDVKTQLIHSIQNKKPSQSYIFDGRDGVGKSTIARNFAMGLMCENFNYNPCQVCDSCVKILSKNHPDIYEVAPDGVSIKTKQIENLQEFIVSKPFLSDRKIVLIYQADTMTISAQNKLLKTLEEPPGNSILILITENMSILLPTIRSRCQLISFQRLLNEQIADVLVNKYSYSEKDAVIHAILADGSLAEALRNIEDDNFVRIRNDVFSFLKSVLYGDISEMLFICENLAESKDYLESALMIMKLWVRDIILLKFKIDNKLLFNTDDVSKLKNLMDVLQTYQWIRIIDKIEEARNQSKAYVQSELVLESLGLNIQEDIDGSCCRCSV